MALFCSLHPFSLTICVVNAMQYMMITQMNVGIKALFEVSCYTYYDDATNLCINEYNNIENIWVCKFRELICIPRAFDMLNGLIKLCKVNHI